MHLVLLLLTIGLAVFGPALIDASERRIVFVVPRYIRRSYDTAQFFGHREPAYKSRRSTRRPYHNGQSFNSEQYFLAEKDRIPQGGDDFDQSIFTPHQQVEHILIPYGKGITHGISFGKGYIPHEELKGMSEEYNFPVSENNHLDFGSLRTGHRGSGQFRFEENQFDSQFQNQEHGLQSGNGGEWPSFAHHQQEGSYGQQEESRDQGYKIQMPSSSSSTNEEIFFPKYSQVQQQQQQQQQESGEERRSIPHQSISTGVSPSLPIIQERKPTPLIFQDTVDMKEYIEKIQAFARNWPHGASLQTFGWQNQIPNPQIQNFNQGSNPWSSYLQPRNPGGGYQVEEESAEESNRRHYRQMMT